MLDLVSEELDFIHGSATDSEFDLDKVTENYYIDSLH